eukprot:2467650-Amphidinium_carterae.1
MAPQTCSASSWRKFVCTSTLGMKIEQLGYLRATDLDTRVTSVLPCSGKSHISTLEQMVSNSEIRNTNQWLVGNPLRHWGPASRASMLPFSFGSGEQPA